MSSKRRRGAPAQEISAGGVVVREGEGVEDAQIVAIVPTRRAADGSRVLGLPKGHVDPGETELEAAAREGREETGILAEPVCQLGETRYWYRRDGRTISKAVSFYLFRYLGGNSEDPLDQGGGGRWIGRRADATPLSP